MRGGHWQRENLIEVEMVGLLSEGTAAEEGVTRRGFDGWDGVRPQVVILLHEDG
jgi:hypothetical protein